MHWRIPDEPLHGLNGWRVCARVEDVSDPDSYDDALAAGFATTDYEGYLSKLLTAPIFGCNRWESS